MELTFTTTKRGERILQINDARITYKNFTGAGDRFNREGDRNFALIIPSEEIKDALINDVNEYGAAWNVKIKPPREDGDDPFMYMNVKVKFTAFGPNVYLKSGNAEPVRLDEESIECLDQMDIASVDLDIRAYDDEINGRGFRSAYLQSIYVVQDFSRDRFASRFNQTADY
jgi:hypothetical protein